MNFTSITFIYYFLPMVILIYFLTPKKLKNVILLFSSLLFYWYGEQHAFFLLIFLCVWNYLIGKYIESQKESKRRKYLLIGGLIADFGFLFYYKYFNFFIENINIVFKTNFSFISVLLPLGISFFTFQAASYLIDIYKGKIKSSKNIIDFSMYLCLFPKLISGPIVRYETVAEEIEQRKMTFHNVYVGIQRFLFGLSKKVLIANVLGELSKNLIQMTNVTILSSWLKAITDMLQLYFDFSGYSDMAIGLGLMFGFHFLENFNYPFIAKSITEFWHRWHISLSSWFKDYIYIPLGGNRKGIKRQYINILIVWLTTGLWHGASWNFIFWGLYFGIFLLIEKRYLLKHLEKHKILGTISTFILVVLGFVFFNHTTMKEVGVSFQNMLGLSHIPFSNVETMYYLKNNIMLIIAAFFFSTPLIKNGIHKITATKVGNKVIAWIEPFFYIVLLMICTAFIIDESFSPFLYFRF